MVDHWTTSIHALRVSSLLPPRRDRLVSNSLQGQVKQEANGILTSLGASWFPNVSVRLVKTTSGSFSKADLVSWSSKSIFE